MAVNSSAGIFDWGPTGRSIEVNASGQLVTTNDPVNGLYPLGYGKTGRALCVDGSGRLCITGVTSGGSASVESYKIDLATNAWITNGSGLFYQDITHGLASRDIMIETYDLSEYKTVMVEDYERATINRVRVYVSVSGLNLRTMILKV